MSGRNVLFIVCLTLQINRLFGQDCYNKFMTLGEDAIKKKQWETAIKQFQAAKFCDPVTYERTHKLDSLINATYAIWIKTSEAARIAAENAGINILLGESNALFIKGNFNALGAKINSSSYCRRAAVTRYLSEIKSFIPDSILDDIIDFTDYIYQGKSYLAILQKKKKESQRVGSRSKNANGADSIKQETEFVLLDSKNNFNVIFAKPLPVPTGKNYYRFIKGSDSILINESNFGRLAIKTYYYEPGYDSVKCIKPNVEKSLKERMESVYKDTIETLAGMGISLEMIEPVKNDSTKQRSRLDISIYQKKQISHAVVEKGLISLTYVKRNNELVVVLKNDTTKGFEIKIYSLVDLSCLYEQANVATYSNLSEVNSSNLLKFNIIGQEKTQYYDFVKGVSVQFLDKPNETTKISKSIKSGYIATLNYYTVPSPNFYTIKVLDNNMNELKRINNSNYGGYRYIAKSDRLLVLGQTYSSYISSTFNWGVPKKEQQSKIVFDTLRVYSLNDGDSIIYTADKIKFINDSIVALLKYNSVEVINFSGKVPYRLLTLENIGQVQFSNLSGLLWLKFKNKDSGNDGFITLIYSTKLQKEIYRSQRLLSKSTGYFFASATDDPNVQELYAIDTFTNEMKCMPVKNIQRKAFLDKRIYFLPSQNIFYTITPLEDLAGDNEDNILSNQELMLTIYKIEITKLIKQAIGTQIDVYNVNKGKLRTIKALSYFDYAEPILFGDFLCYKPSSYDDIVGDDESDVGKCFVFNINSLKN
ncbi:MULTISPECIES: hypothetical protein [Niastella]|uniref:Uncharacterized protein n=1 Tax=Niastella soli TaxID=2821487 RepID=A0ABS3Z121_9BACT|nr:hypothetical protein [Niastella soli]MBO9203855.1 hypothetical protein [Niastella soli]